MNFFQKPPQRIGHSSELSKPNPRSFSQTVYPNLCRQIDSSQLVRHPSKLQLYAAIKSQNLTDDISQYFGEFQPAVLENDEVDSLLLTKLLGWSDDVIANSDKNIEIIVGQKFIKTNTETSNSLFKNTIETNTIAKTTTKIETVHGSQIGNPFAANVSQFDEFLKRTYENYCKNFQGDKSKAAQPDLTQTEDPKHFLPRNNLEQRRSHLHNRLSNNNFNKQFYMSKQVPFLEAEESADEVIEDIIYLPNRLHAHPHTSFSGFHCLQHAKSDKLTATTMAMIL